ncbi:unnamed protein product, partial [Ceratitis capitata]
PNSPAPDIIHCDAQREQQFDRNSLAALSNEMYTIKSTQRSQNHIALAITS